MEEVKPKKSRKKATAVAINEQALPIGENPTITKEEQLQKMQDDIKAFVADSTNKAQAFKLATQIGDATHFNWFEISRLLKKSKETKESILAKLHTLMLFGHCIQDGYKYKVVFKKIDLLNNINEKIRAKELEVKILRNQAEELNRDIIEESAKKEVELNQSKSIVTLEEAIAPTTTPKIIL